jgi:hypothetical protein
MANGQNGAHVCDRDDGMGPVCGYVGLAWFPTGDGGTMELGQFLQNFEEPRSLRCLHVQAIPNRLASAYIPGCVGACSYDATIYTLFGSSVVSTRFRGSTLPTPESSKVHKIPLRGSTLDIMSDKLAASSLC